MQANLLLAAKNATQASTLVQAGSARSALTGPWSIPRPASASSVAARQASSLLEMTVFLMQITKPLKTMSHPLIMRRESYTTMLSRLTEQSNQAPQSTLRSLTSILHLRQSDVGRETTASPVRHLPTCACFHSTTRRARLVYSTTLLSNRAPQLPVQNTQILTTRLVCHG